LLPERKRQNPVKKITIRGEGTLEYTTGGSLK